MAKAFFSIGMDRPSNYDEQHAFIVSDIEEVADPVKYHSGDMAIAFRRFIEKGEG